MLRSIRSDPQWAWANNDATTADVEASLARIDGIFKSPFFLQYCSQDVSQVRKLYTEIEFITHLDSFTNQVGPEVSTLENEVKLIMGMHQSRRKVNSSKK